MPETVHTTLGGRHRRVYHTDRNCVYLLQAESKIQERSLDELDKEWSECSKCGGNLVKSGADFSLYEAAVAAGQEGESDA